MERSPAGSDQWFGVARVGVGMTSLTEAGAVNFAEPNMPTEIEMEPATGKALQEFVRYQSVAYRTPALISLLVEPGYRLDGDRARVLALMRAIICQLVFAHGPDHLRLIVVTDDVAQWDWLKWLPHAGDPASRTPQARCAWYRLGRRVLRRPARRSHQGPQCLQPPPRREEGPGEPTAAHRGHQRHHRLGLVRGHRHTGTDGVTFDLRGGVPTRQGRRDCCASTRTR